MNMSRKLGLGGIAAALVSLAACHKVADPQPNTAHDDNTVAEGMTPAARTRSAAEQIAQSRCERESQCGNIGADKTFSSSQDCLARIQNDWKEDLNKRQCPGGINQHELTECLQQVRTEACGNPFDTLARITECTSGQICIEQP